MEPTAVERAARFQERLLRLRRLLFWVFIFGLLGTGSELLITEHTESLAQWIPLVLILLGLVAIVRQEYLPSPGGSQLLRVVLLLFILSGALGTALHWRGKMEFQLEGNPSLAGWELFRQAAETKTPPALAPGVMIQLGLVGLAYQAAATVARIQREGT